MLSQLKHATTTMDIIDTAIPDVKIIKPRVWNDERGFFLESFNARRFQELTGIEVSFVQDNHSKSMRGVIRGLHYQIERTQGKLVRVISGRVFDVAVDLRKSSPSFGQWVGEVLTADNFYQMWVPPGFAHGFLVLEDNTEFLYKTSDFHAPEYERTIQWDDPDLGIDWPMADLDVRLSDKDKSGNSFANAEVFN